MDFGGIIVGKLAGGCGGERSEPAEGSGWWGGGRDIVCNLLRWGKPYKRF